MIMNPERPPRNKKRLQPQQVVVSPSITPQYIDTVPSNPFSLLPVLFQGFSVNSHLFSIEIHQQSQGRRCGDQPDGHGHRSRTETRSLMSTLRSLQDHLAAIPPGSPYCIIEPGVSPSSTPGYRLLWLRHHETSTFRAIIESTDARPLLFRRLKIRLRLLTGGTHDMRASFHAQQRHHITSNGIIRIQRLFLQSYLGERLLVIQLPGQTP